MYNQSKPFFVKIAVLFAVFGFITVGAGCIGQRQVDGSKDYGQLAEQVKRCDKLSDESSIEKCRNAIVEQLSDDEKEKLVDQLQTTGYYPQ